MYLFAYQAPAPFLLRVAGGAYTLTLLPAGILAIWLKRISGIWMIVVSLLSASALCINEIARFRPSDGMTYLIASLLWWTFIATIPGFIGLMLLKSERKKQRRALK